MNSEATRSANQSGLASLEREVKGVLASLESRGRLRQLRSGQPAATPVSPMDLNHNDYLGLRSDLVFRERVLSAVSSLPVSSGGSRLLGGEHPIFAEIEHQFSEFKGAPSSLYFPSGYSANETVAVALAHSSRGDEGCTFFSDALNHASIIDGIRLAGLAKKRRIIFPHGHLEALEEALCQSAADRNVIFTESLFSMDGDSPDLQALASLASRYRGVLVVDEAHSTGCLGPGGKGLLAAACIDQEKVISINTCGKGLGVQGAFVCGPSWFRDFLINTGRQFIYTTGPSPWLAAALKVSISYLPELDERRSALIRASFALRKGLADLGYQVGNGRSHIIPVICGKDRTAVAMKEHLERRGIYVGAIRPPTVPEGTARLRLSVSSAIGEREIDYILNVFEDLRLTYG